MVKNMVIRGQRVIFVTDIPSADPCAAGGSSWLMELDARNGGRLPETPFDFDVDGNFTVSDLVKGDFDGDGKDVVGSGIRHKTPGGKFSAPTIIRDLDSGTDREKKLMSNSDGTITMIDERDGDKGLGRRSWQQLLSP
jgi:type IV pilus assembly protein PilY1